MLDIPKYASAAINSVFLACGALTARTSPVRIDEIGAIKLSRQFALQRNRRIFAWHTADLQFRLLIKFGDPIELPAPTRNLAQPIWLWHFLLVIP